MLRIDLQGWYFTPDGDLRACVVTSADGVIGVIDSETLESVDVNPDDVMIERPE